MSTSVRLIGLSTLALVLAPVLAFASQTTVTMTGSNTYSPQSIGIYTGDTVTWLNQGNAVNSVTSDGNLFASGPIQPGQQFSATFNQAGSFTYHSTYNAGMTGTITVSPSPSGAYTNPNSTYFDPANTVPAVPAAASSGSTAALYAQIQTLLAQIAALQAAQGTGTGSVPGSNVPVLNTSSSAYNSSSCPNIGRSLKLGESGDDVTRLQKFLATDASVYPEGVVSGYYGSLTQAAVQRWQTKFHVVSSGTPDTTGFGVVGPRTAAAMALLCTTGSVNGVSAGAPVGGFIQVTPVSGAAPLAVNVTATVNTGSSCGGAVYTLDFGDGTPAQQIPTSAGNCSQQSQTYQHTYVYGGTYQILLAAAGHQTSASVTVSGPPAPSGGTGGVTGTGPSTESPSVARGTMSAFATSGNAPFTATFYVSCASGVKYNVIFGDGTDLGGNAVSSTACKNGSLDSITHTYNSVGDYTAQLVIFSLQSNGTIIPNNIANVGISVGSVASNYTYNPPQLSTGANQYSFNIQFDLPTACTGYDLAWGDGSPHVIQNDRGTSCAQTPTTITQSHTYATSTSAQYTITLKRGASLGQSDTIGVTVSQ